jgi:UDP-sulfoquinovose synthase
MMKVLILGGDGYLGWPTAMHLATSGFEVCLVDNLAKKQWEASVGVSPLFPVPTFHDRVKKWNAVKEKSKIKFHICDVAENRHLLYKIIDEFSPSAIVHYAEQPSAPFSHIDADRVLYTQRNNVMGTLNLIMAVLHTNKDCHIIKLGTMGEYGTPNIDIEEGWLDVCHNGREDRVLYPKKPGSWYHLSKVHDSHNLEHEDGSTLSILSDVFVLQSRIQRWKKSLGS